MPFSALDLRAFFVAQIVPPAAALRLGNEVQLFLPVIFDKHRPIRIVGSKRRGDFEPGRKLGVNLDRLVGFEVFGEPLFDPAESYTTCW